MRAATVSLLGASTDTSAPARLFHDPAECVDVIYAANVPGMKNVASRVGSSRIMTDSR